MRSAACFWASSLVNVPESTCFWYDASMLVTSCTRLLTVACFSCMIRSRINGTSANIVASTSARQVITDRVMILEKIPQSLYALIFTAPSFQQDLVNSNKYSKQYNCQLWEIRIFAFFTVI